MYLHSVNPMFSSLYLARRLLWVFSSILSAGLLAAAYNFLLFTFNTELSQRRGYMSIAIAEAHIFFATRQALLERISLSASRQPIDESVSAEEIHLLLGSSVQHQWSPWMTERLQDYLKAKQVSLVYVSTGVNAKVYRLYNATSAVSELSETILRQLEPLKLNDKAQFKELWLVEQDNPEALLYIFIRLDERDRQSG